MVIILSLMITFLFIEIYAKEPQDTISLDRYSSIYQNGRYCIVVNKPEKERCDFNLTSFNINASYHRNENHRMLSRISLL